MVFIDAKMVHMTKARAESLFSRGRLGDALSTYEKIRPCGAKDPRINLRMGDISRKLGDEPSAIGHYREASENFARLGFVIKAVAVCKMIIKMDPSQEDIHRRLAELCSTGPAGAAGREGAARPPGETGGRGAAADARPEEAAPEDGAEAGAELKRLPRTPLFSDFSQKEFADVIKKVRSKELSPGEYLFREGERGDSIFFIADGSAEVLCRTDEGAELVLAKLGEGDVLGEFGFFSNSRRSSGVKAATALNVLELTKDDLDEIISVHKRVETVLFDFYKERVVERLMALSTVFGPLPEADRKEVIKALRPVRFAEGAVIMKEGERGAEMYLIKQGRVSIWAKETGGGKAVIAELAEGDFFGEIALATLRARVANVTALSGVELVEFSREVRKDISSRRPEIKGVLAGVIKERVSEAALAKEHRAAMT